MTMGLSSKLWYNSSMQNLICAVVLGAVATGALFTKDADKVEKTMTVNRCQAVLKDGTQCKSQAEDGKDFCWKHRTVNAVNETLTDTKEGSKKAWESTKSWSTNVWETTKSGAKDVWQNTKDRAKEVQEGWSDIFSKEAKRDKQVGR